MFRITSLVAKQSNFYSNPQETASRIAAEILEQQERGNKRRRPNTKSNIVKKKPDSQMTNVILVHGRQRGNPLLKHIKFVKKEFHDDIKADYVVGTAVGVLFLSVKYHLLHPNYVRRRLAEIRGAYQLSILLLMVDEDRPDSVIEALTVLCVKEKVTIICCWSNEEGGRYLETFKVYEKKSAKMIQANIEGTYASHLTEFLTSIRSVTKRDVLTLISTFGTLKNIMSASLLQLSLCPGIGPTKCRNIYEAFNGPISVQPILRNDPRAPITTGASGGSSRSSSSITGGSSSNSGQVDYGSYLGDGDYGGYSGDLE